MPWHMQACRLLKSDWLIHVTSIHLFHNIVATLASVFHIRFCYLDDSLMQVVELSLSQTVVKPPSTQTLDTITRQLCAHSSSQDVFCTDKQKVRIWLRQTIQPACQSSLVPSLLHLQLFMCIVYTIQTASQNWNSHDIIMKSLGRKY